MPALFYVSQAILWVFVIGEGILLLLLYRHFGLIAMDRLEGVQRDGLRVGTQAPALSGLTAQGEPVSWAPAPGRSHLLAFVSPDCAPCARILPHIVGLRVADSDLDVALVVDGTQEQLARLVETFAPPSYFTCLARDGAQGTHPYEVRVTPFAFLIGGDGRILAKGLCDKPARLRQLLATAGFEQVMNLDPVSSRYLPILTDIR